MRLESLKLRGIGPFREEVTLDLSAIEGDVVALTGNNGSGKTTLVGMWPSAMFREEPVRGKLAALATARDSYVEVTVVNGQRYTIRQSVDGISSKGEALVMSGAAPVLADTKVSSFDLWAKSHLPTPEVFFASQFGAQGSGGLLTMDKGARKAVVLRALGIEHLEGLAERCREERRTVDAQRDTLLGRIADEEVRGGDVAKLNAELEEAATASARLVADLLEAEGAVEAAREAAQKEALARQTYETAIETRHRLRSEIKHAETALIEDEERINNNRAVLNDAGKIREAAASLDDLQAGLRGAQSELATCKASVLANEGKIAQLETSATDARRRLSEAEQRVARAEAKLANCAQVEDAEKRLPVLREALKEAQAKLDGLELELTRARAAHITGAGERIELLRTGLGAVTVLTSARPLPTLHEASDQAQRTLDADDEHVEAAKLAPLEVARLERELASAKRQLEAAQAEVRSWERLADQRAQLDAVEATLTADRDALDAERTSLSQTSAKLQAARVALEQAYEDLRAAESKARTKAEALEGAQQIAKRLERLTAAETRITELEAINAERSARITKLEKDLRDAPEPSPPPVAPELSPLIVKVNACRAAIEKLSTERAALSAALETATQSAARLTLLRAELAGVDDDLSDWTRLAQDLGRDGLQAVEIDAAGPAITDLTNDLLHQAFGTRFTVSFETTRLSSDGKKEIEDFRITVLDTTNGREADAKTFSGGEKVILSEAIALALTVLACQRSGVERPTIIRDESGAALDGANGQRYVAMLRRAAKIIQADKVLFISHDPATWDLADARINVCDGRIAVS